MFHMILCIYSIHFSVKMYREKVFINSLSAILKCRKYNTPWRSKTWIVRWWAGVFLWTAVTYPQTGIQPESLGSLQIHHFGTSRSYFLQWIGRKRTVRHTASPAVGLELKSRRRQRWHRTGRWLHLPDWKQRGWRGMVRLPHLSTVFVNR